MILFFFFSLLGGGVFSLLRNSFPTTERVRVIFLTRQPYDGATAERQVSKMGSEKYATLSIRVTEQEKTDFKVLAAKKGTTMSEWVREFIQNELNKEEGK